MLLGLMFTGASQFTHKVHVVVLAVIDGPDGDAKTERALNIDVGVEVFQGGFFTAQPFAHRLEPALGLFVAGRRHIELYCKSLKITR